MLGNEIKQHRQRLGLSTKELARLVGVAPVTVDGWESSDLKVPRSVRLRVALERLEIRHREAEFAGWPTLVGVLAGAIPARETIRYYGRAGGIALSPTIS
jgi:transcriptional regulator with XRE-family HTH domain